MRSSGCVITRSIRRSNPLSIPTLLESDAMLSANRKYRAAQDAAFKESRDPARSTPCIRSARRRVTVSLPDARAAMQSLEEIARQARVLGL
jgi:hypothetical protein